LLDEFNLNNKHFNVLYVYRILRMWEHAEGEGLGINQDIFLRNFLLVFDIMFTSFMESIYTPVKPGPMPYTHIGMRAHTSLFTHLHIHRCTHCGIVTPSSPSDATTLLFASRGLLNYFLPFNLVLDAFCPIIHFYNP
jgi:hypothetical protein